MARANLEASISADATQFNAVMRRSAAMAQATGRKISAGMASAGRSMVAAGRTAMNLGKHLAIVGVVGAGAFAAGIKGAADLGGVLSDLSARTGIAAGQLAIMQRAFEDNGVSGDKVGATINKLQKGIADFGRGVESASRPFDALGISFAEISALSPDKQFELIQRKIAAIQDPTLRAATAMQIFGRSGGELLTLFADSGAFDNAGKFVGTQAEILNRSAGIFDAISDKLARVPDKLKGFFVGFLEPFAAKIDSMLTSFDSFDFAALGQRLATGLNADTIRLVLSEAFVLASMAFVEYMGKAVGAVAALLATVLSNGEYWMSIGKAAVNGLMSSMLLGIDAFMTMWSEKSETAGTTLADSINDALKSVDFAPSGQLTKAAEDFAKKMEDLFPAVSSPSPSPVAPSGSSAASEYDKELAEQKARVAADAAAMAGVKPSAALIKWGKGSSSIANSVDTGKEFAPANTFGGLDRLKGMQRDMKNGFGVGTTGVFARDRAGKSNWNRGPVGLEGATGGLGAKRAVGQQKSEADAKKSLESQKTAEEHLLAISKTIGQALTVA